MEDVRKNNIFFYKSSLGEIGKHGRFKTCSFLGIGSSPIVSTLSRPTPLSIKFHSDDKGIGK
jgi:hypothetical protein